MTLLELCDALRGLLELGAVTTRFAVGLIVSRHGISRLAAGVLLAGVRS